MDYINRPQTYTTHQPSFVKGNKAHIEVICKKCGFKQIFDKTIKDGCVELNITNCPNYCNDKFIYLIEY